MFDKEKFIEYVRENFSYNNNYISLLSNVIDYGIENLDYSENQLAYFIREMMNYDIELDEILMFDREKYIERVKDYYMDQLKKSIIDYINKEFKEDNSYEDFDKLYPDLSHIGLAYTDTPDGKHSIQYEINLEEKTWTQYVNDVAIKNESFVYEDIPDIQAIKDMTEAIKMSSFEDLVSVDEEDLKQALGLEIDDNGNFYDPLEDISNRKDYWIVEFNEGHEIVPDYSGQVVTKNLINILRQKDIEINLHNQTYGETELGEITDDYIGYFKFYFDHYIDNEVVEQYSIDLGDGKEVNEYGFSYLEKQVKISEEKSLKEPKQELEEKKPKRSDRGFSR